MNGTQSIKYDESQTEKLAIDDFEPIQAEWKKVRDFILDYFETVHLPQEEVLGNCYVVQDFFKRGVSQIKSQLESKKQDVQGHFEFLYGHSETSFSNCQMGTLSLIEPLLSYPNNLSVELRSLLIEYLSHTDKFVKLKFNKLHIALECDYDTMYNGNTDLIESLIEKEGALSFLTTNFEDNLPHHMPNLHPNIMNYLLSCFS